MPMTRTRPRGPTCAWRAVLVAVMLTFATLASPVGQGTFSSLEMYSSGQNIVPVFDGWEQSSDGSFTMVFGYFNRNWKEQPDVPIGPNNNIEPGSPDQGQPTHFYPRRNRFVFRVKVPKDFGKNEIVWTL